MELSNINSNFSIKVVRDGTFISMGSFIHNSSKQLVFFNNEKFIPILLEKKNISCVILKKELISKVPEYLGIGISEDPEKSYYELHNYLAKNTDFYWKDFQNEISENSIIHPTAYIAEKNIRIGDGCIIGPKACILERTVLENNVIIGPGSVIGGEGFRFIRKQNYMIPIVHAGGVLVHDQVEIQANSCVDKGLYGNFTEIGEETKIDNLVHVGHNVRIGKRCSLVASSMIGGSTRIGDDVWIGPNSSISDNIEIGDRVWVTLGSVVTKNVTNDQRVTGNFAIDHEKFINFIKSIR
jgi:UDP-3-O-[3-hydroxymyristoyl] glucosamine N-acyltransferase